MAITDFHSHAGYRDQIKSRISAEARTIIIAFIAGLGSACLALATGEHVGLFDELDPIEQTP